LSIPSGGIWFFYLQESVTVTIYTLRKKKCCCGKPGWWTEADAVFAATPVYPAGGHSYGPEHNPRSGVVSWMGGVVNNTTILSRKVGHIR
jgi:hypothetical protein